MAIAAVLGAYVISGYIGVSGFMAAFTVGMICGNKSMFNLKAVEENCETHEKFKDITISLIRMLIFMLYG
ncbi:MAG: cation:proton antiporter [Eubacteriaceae bacterium]|nr:cation:proton antiporter [Eubacteriaceae bacterium]